MPERPSRFASMDMGQANAECLRRDSVVFDTCPVCKTKVGLHCSDCKIQTTGCLCTEIDRFGNDEAWRRACERFGQELAAENYRRAGLYVPKGIQ